MLTPRRRLGTGIVISILAVLAAGLLRYALSPELGTAVPFSFFLFSVVASAWFGGLWPGLLATLLGAFLGDFFFVPPAGHLSTLTTYHAIQVGSFILVGFSISAVSELWIRSRQRLMLIVASSEAQFSAIADFAPAKLWITDASGRCTYLSPKWYDFSGRSPAEDLGLGWMNLLHSDDRYLVEKAIAKASQERIPFALDARFRRKDGQYRWMADAGTPRLSESGEFLGYVGVVIDVHERKNIEQELKEADRRKDEFLATLAHELRNPLAPIRNGLHLMKLAERDAATVERARGMVDRQVAQMVRLIDDLLDVSRIASGKIELRKEWVNLHDAVQSAVETSRPLMDSRGQELVVTLPDGPILLEADMTRLAQSFSNLLQNAAKYSERGGRILVTAQKGDGRVLVSVRDDGMGISPELLPYVFDLFVQEARGRRRAQGGLGIGLTLVKRLIELHGGAVEARSEGVGRGSEFLVTLPMVELPAIPRADGSPSEDGIAGNGNRRRVLIVDDNDDSVESLAMLLGYFGHEVEKASDGESAMQAAERFAPDTILLDLGMPGMSGYEVCRAIRRQPWGPPMTLIALTGWGQIEDRERTREAGFDHHLVKPVEPVVIRELLSRPPLRPAEPTPTHV
jgi:PAS domain S-box-containing protein